MTIRKVNTLDEMFTRRQAQKSAGLEILQESANLKKSIFIWRPVVGISIAI